MDCTIRRGRTENGRSRANNVFPSPFLSLRQNGREGRDVDKKNVNTLRRANYVFPCLFLSLRKMKKGRFGGGKEREYRGQEKGENGRGDRGDDKEEGEGGEGGGKDRRRIGGEDKGDGEGGEGGGKDSRRIGGDDKGDGMRTNYVFPCPFLSLRHREEKRR